MILFFGLTYKWKAKRLDINSIYHILQNFQNVFFFIGLIPASINQLLKFVDLTVHNATSTHSVITPCSHQANRMNGWTGERPSWIQRYQIYEVGYYVVCLWYINSIEYKEACVIICNSGLISMHI